MTDKEVNRIYLEDLRQTLYKLQAITAALNDALSEAEPEPGKPNCYSLSLASMDYIRQAFRTLNQFEQENDTIQATVNDNADE